VNRLRAGYRALAEDLGYGVVGTMLWAVFSTWVVVYLDRKYGRRWANGVRYLELTFPTVMAVGMTFVTVAMPPTGDDLDEYRVFVALAGYFVVTAVAAWVGVVRRWRWWVRWGLYVLATAALFGLAVVVAALDHAGPGG
jgi:hypothetical protein